MSNLPQKQKFSVALQTPTYQKLIYDTLTDKTRARNFIANISSAVATNPELQECEPSTILSCGLLGESLNLVPSPQLGQYYLVPFKKKTRNTDGSFKETKQAQFILGYKGYLQLAIRSGHYKKINVTEIKQGELISFNPLEEEIVVKLIDDFEERSQAETIGYYAMFEYTNGFKKAIYWSKAQMVAHADKHSNAFNAESARKLENGEIKESEKWKYSSNWYANFDEMAKKTMLRQLISKWGILSMEMQQAIDKDNNIINIDDNNNFVAQVDDDADFSKIIEEVEPTPEKQPQQIDINAL